MTRLKKAGYLKMINKVFDKCIKRTNEKRLSVCDVGTKLTFVNENQDELMRVKIDGCILLTSDPVLRCDFMVQHKEINYYVELKAIRYYKKACWQLAKSIEMFNKCFGNKTCQPVVVTLRKKTPDIPQVDIAKSGLKDYIQKGFCEQPVSVKSHSDWDLF